VSQAEKNPQELDKWQDDILSRLICKTHLEISVGELVFHVFSIAVNKKQPGWSFSSDRHEHHELIYTSRGCGTYEMLGQSRTVSEGELFFTPRNVLHNGWAHEEIPSWDSLVVELDFSLAHDPETYLDDIGSFPAVMPFYKHFILQSEATLPVPIELRPQIGLIIERLILEMESKGSDFELILQSCMIEYLVLVSRAAQHSIAQIPLGQYAGRVRRLLRLEKARQFLRENYTEEHSLSDIAKKAHLSQFHFVRLFKGAFGLTPLQYRVQLRLEEAKRLLVMTDMQVSEVAYRLGYCSPEYFSRVFTKKIGCPPRDFARHIVEEEKAESKP